MRKSSTDRKSSLNPVRMSVHDREDREDKGAGRSDARTAQTSKFKGQSLGDSSLIPRPRIRSSSSERVSIRKSYLKTCAKTPLSQPRQGISRPATTTPVTPRVGSSLMHPDPASSSTRHRSPSAERASGFAKGPRKDTRPINDKSYQSAMLNKIDSYFLIIDQTFMLNPSGSLKPVTLKMFIETTTCLLKLLDVKHDVTINNYTEELPKIAKKLHYPGTLTKSWLKTANTMHSWPQVLAWLSWLVDINDAKDLAACAFQIENIPFVGIDDDEKERNRSTFLSMLKCYAAWNDENLTEEAALIERHIQNMSNHHGDIGAEIAAAVANLEKEKASFHLMEQKSNDLDAEVNALQKTLDDLKQKDSKEIEYINATRGSMNRVKREIQQLEEHSKTMKSQIETDAIQQAQLKILIDNQPMSVTERDAIVKQCSEIQNYIYQFKNHVTDIERELYAMDMKFASYNQNLYKAILAYNKDIIMYLGCEPGIDLEELKMPEDNICSHDFIEILRVKEAALSNVKDRVCKELNETESLIGANKNEVESLKERLRTLREENESHVERMSELKISVQQIQRKTKETEIKLKKQIKSVENDIVELRSSMPDLDYAVNELKEVREKYEAVVRRNECAKRSAERFFNKFYEMRAKQRNDLANLLKKFPKPDE